jgi:hypothetical protein
MIEAVGTSVTTELADVAVEAEAEAEAEAVADTEFETILVAGPEF